MKLIILKGTMADGKRLVPDLKKTQDVSDKAGRLLLAYGLAKKPGGDSAAVDPEIVEAIKLLDPDKHYTDGGIPDLKALSEVAGRKVTAAERDAAFEAYEAE